MQNKTIIFEQCYFCCKSGLELTGYGAKYCQSCYNSEKERFDIAYNNKELYASIDEITDKLYLGNIDGAMSLDLLCVYQITHIISVAIFVPKYFPKEFEYKQIELIDDSSQIINIYFKEVIEYIESAGKVYIHCIGGISRSASFVLAYLMWKDKLSFDDANKLLKSKRKSININEGFEKQLKEFELLLIEKNYNLD